jgi:hypothetical protein
MHVWGDEPISGAEMEERAKLANEAVMQQRIAALHRLSLDARALNQRGKMDFTYYESVDALVESVK